MKKQIHILEGLFIIVFVFICSFLAIKFIYNVNHEKIDTSYMWNIEMSNIVISDGSVDGDISLEDNEVILDVVFKSDGSFYEFSFNISNNGSLDAYLINENLVAQVDNDCLNYAISYSNGTEIKEGDILESNETKNIVVRIEYPKQDDKVYKELNLKLNFSLEYGTEL